MVWLKAQALEVGIVARFPNDDGSTPRGDEIVDREMVDSNAIRFRTRSREVFIHPEEKVEIIPISFDDADEGDLLAREMEFVELFGAPACDLIGGR